MKHGVGYVFLRIIIWKIRLSPRKVALFLASIFGKLAFRFLRKDRKIALKNLEIAFPDKSLEEREKLARETFRQSAMNLFDAMRTRKNVLSEPPIWEIEGAEYFEKFHEDYGGGVVITGHIGCFELIPGIWKRLGYKIAVVGRRLYDERVDRLLIKQRESMGIVNVPSDANPRVIARLIREGYFVGFLMDTFTESVDGIQSRFFGRETRTISGPIALARLMGRPVLPMAIYRREKYGFLLKVLPPMEINKTADKNADIADGVLRANAILEKMILDRPDQWIWYHDRFRDVKSPFA
ncbi:hypothetical protein DRQ36_03065 [bacterium]|nr:MAG: hypothetical protein DRQ36_03065 [bacterium]